ncbi:MAG TPA: FtsQ-type POTRA domain-containing protein [bacterium]|nr:FtsQ-type POTRA domain-containing protein [bacterium]
MKVRIKQRIEKRKRKNPRRLRLSSRRYARDYREHSLNFFSGFLFLAVFCVMLYGGFRFKNWVDSSGCLVVKEIVLEGHQYLAKEEIERVIRPGQIIFFYTSGRIKRLLRDLNWVDRVNVFFDFPDKVVLKIKEKQPLFLAETGEGFRVITESKESLRMVKKITPVFEDFHELPDNKRDEIVDFLSVFRKKGDQWFRSIQSLRWDPREGLIFKMNHYLIKWGEIEEHEIEPKLRYLGQILEKLSDAKKFPEYMDLRFVQKGEVLVKEKKEKGAR